MGYIEGFVLAVPAQNKEKFHRVAQAAAPIFRDHGATRVVESWGDDVPDGKVTDFKGSVQAKADEVVVFSWIEYPSRSVRESAHAAFTSDPRFAEMDEMPLDGKRMIMGGFETLVDEGEARKGSYADGYLLAVPGDRKEAYRKIASFAAPIFIEHGATRVVEAWEDQVPDGQVTDFRRAVKAEPGEKIVFSFAEWPSREARQEGWKKIMEDERMKPEETPPFDGKRMIYGGFEILVDA